MFRKLMSVLLIIALLVCNVGTIAFAEVVAGYSAENSEVVNTTSEEEIIDSGKCGDKLTWTLYKDGILKISGTGKMYNYSSTDQPWGLYCKDGRMNIRLVLEEGITSIGRCAFEDCINLKGELIIPKTVIEIGTFAFRGCNGFTGGLVLPSGITIINIGTFSRCSGFTGKLEIPEGVTEIGQVAFLDCSGFTGKLEIPKSVTAIGSSAFSGCSSFTGELVIPSGITKISSHAFYNCSGFSGELEIPEDVTIIESYAFSGCDGFIGELVIPSGITKIDDGTFFGCSGFTGKLEIPEGVTTIGLSAFFGCSGFTGELEIPEGVTTIGSYAFCGCSGFTGELVIPFGITKVDENTFSGCKGLTGKLEIPESVTTIETEAFHGCSGLTGKLEIPESVTEIGSYAFNGCSGFTGELVIPSGITKIESGTFYYCSGLTGELEIPESVTEIGSYAFFGCKGLTGKLEIPESVIKIGSHALFGTNITVQIPYNATNADYLIQYVVTNDTKYEVTGIDVKGYNGFYDGNVHSITVNAPTGSTVTYSTSKNGLYLATKPVFINVGDYTVYYKITKDNIVLTSGSAVVNIEVKSIDDMTAKLEYDTVVYDGSAKEPKATVDGLATSDFIVTYTENVNIGEATVTITGVGNYTDTITKKFTIEAKSIEGMEAELEYDYVNCDGTAKTPVVTIEGLTSADFEVAYTNNIEIGTATVTITGIGNYTGVIRKTFEIEEGIIGDVNDDGIINTIDASTVISYYYGNVEFDETQMRLADVNGDGVVNTIDASMIISYYYGKIDGFAQ